MNQTSPPAILDPVRAEALRRQLVTPLSGKAFAGRLGGLRTADRYNWKSSEHGKSLHSYRGVRALQKHHPLHQERIRNGHYRRLALAKHGEPQ